MTSPSEPPAEAQNTILFRPSKKRKITSYRQRASTPDEPTSTTIATSASPPPQSLDELISSTAGDAQAEAKGTEVPISEILRLRKLARKGKGGVEFRAEGSHLKESENPKALVRRDSNDHEESEMQEQGGLGVVRRFATQTGTVGDVNRHMMAYIDSELAKRNASSSSIHPGTKPPSTTALPTRTPELGPGDGMVSRKEAGVSRQPATLGKLMEIDLGPSARESNEQLTDRAKRRLEGENVPDDSLTKKPPKIRLGRDGKPWRGPKRKRRGSDDIARDKLVEDVLRDNRLEIFEPPPEEEMRNGTGNDEAADDRIAEAFRREFMDAVGARQRKKQVGPPTVAGGKGKKGEEELKGPKLGGSRSARAAMREVMLKEQAGKK